jgi:hypothetical protein
VTSAGAALLFDGGIGAGVVGTTTAHDQVFVVAGTEGFRLDQTSKQMKFPATSITANGSGAITAPGSIAPVAVSVQEWLTFKNAAGATRYMQMWG